MSRLRLALLVPAAVALIGCPGNKLKPLHRGEYVARDVKAVSVIVDDATATATFTVDGKTIKRPFKTRDKERWQTECRMNMAATTVEVIDLPGDPIQVGGTRFERPVLVAGCGNPHTMRLSTLDAAGVGGTQPSVLFDHK